HQETPRKRLARLIDEERSRRGMHWIEVARRAGLTKEGLRNVRQGTGEIRAKTKRGLERALGWAPGSIDEILAGRDPIPAQTQDTPPAPVEQQPAVAEHDSPRGSEVVDLAYSTEDGTRVAVLLQGMEQQVHAIAKMMR